jgi:tetratricopeptide (TPR) repeat protein
VFGLITRQILEQNYEEAISNCERLLRYLPAYSPLRIDTLAHLGTAYGMLQNYAGSYEALTEALTLNPKDPYLWYNRGLASRFTSRAGRSYRDFERAAELNTSPELKEELAEAVNFSRELAEGVMKERGPDFTLDQLIEQEDRYQQALEKMQAQKWEEAIQSFQATIAMGDCLPQPWGNMGTCLMMLERYDEAEAAWKRALIIEPDYTIASNNLAALPATRLNGPPTRFGMVDPFVAAGVEQGIHFIEE